MICPKCGYETTGGTCSHCGAQFMNKEQASMSEAAQALKRGWAEDQSRAGAHYEDDAAQKQNWAPVLSVLLPGLGQTYLGNKWGPIISLFYCSLFVWLGSELNDPLGGAWFPVIAIVATWLVSVYRAFPRD